MLCMLNFITTCTCTMYNVSSTGSEIGNLESVVANPAMKKTSSRGNSSRCVTVIRNDVQLHKLQKSIPVSSDTLGTCDKSVR